MRYIFVKKIGNVWKPAFSEWENNSEALCLSSARDSNLSDKYPNLTGSPCFRMASLPYAQTSYFACVVMV